MLTTSTTLNYQMNTRPTSKEVNKVCYQALAALGVQMKYESGIWSMDEHFSGWIGLNQGVHPTFVRVNPHVGIHCVAVMKLLAEAKGEKYRKGEYATFGCYIGTLCPDVQQFIFESEADLLPEAERLTETIRQYGMPYIQSLTSYHALLPCLRDSVANMGWPGAKYAAALYLSGDIQGAFSFLENQIAKLLADRHVSGAETLQKLKTCIESKL